MEQNKEALMSIEYESSGHIRTIRFNRPEKMNALNPSHLTELSRVENE